MERNRFHITGGTSHSLGQDQGQGQLPHLLDHVLSLDHVPDRVRCLPAMDGVVVIQGRSHGQDQDHQGGDMETEEGNMEGLFIQRFQRQRI